MANSRKQRLFNELSVNLSAYTEGEHSGLFACPLCLRLFSSVDQLSDAHIFPKALGGSTITLTCRDCNNKIGSSIESYESTRIKFNRAFLGDGKSSCKALLIPKIDDIYSQDIGKVTTEMRVVQNEARTELHFQVPSGGYSPQALDEIIRSWGKTGYSVDIQFQVPNWDRAKLTYLHSAFLFLFSQLGYEWVLDPCTELIREQLQKPDENLLNFKPLVINASELVDCIPSDQLHMSWYLLTEPEESKGFFIVFSDLGNLDNLIGVWMPLFGCCYYKPPRSNFRLLPLPRLERHLSTFNFRYSGHHLVNSIFGNC